jgi:cytosine/adenosine deaminase-related metal-dependent hydrolase
VAGRLLVRGGHVVTMDERLGDLPEADVLVEEGKILAVAPSLPETDAEVIDARGTVVLPGFVDTHRHLWASVLRAAQADLTLRAYRDATRDVLGHAFRPQDVHAGTLLGAWEAINAGITTVLDYAHLNPTVEHAEAGIEALRETGIRALYAHGSAIAAQREADAPEQAGYVRLLRQRHFSSDDGLLTFGIAFGSPFGAADWALVEELSARASLHACVRSTGDSSVVHTISDLARRGSLRPGTVYSHCTNATDHELVLVRDSGGHVSVAPYIEMLMGHGRPVTVRALAHGLRPGLAADVVSSGPGDMFSVMRVAFAQARAETVPMSPEEPYEPAVTTRDILRAATVDGAAACGLGRVTGSLAAGKQADLVLVRVDQVNTLPMTDPVGTVVCAADVSNVDTVLVRGVVRKQHGRLVGYDARRVAGLAGESSRHVLSGCSGA